PALPDSDPTLRAEAAHMLGRIKDRTAGVPLVNLFKDPDAKVRDAAMEAIGHVADAPALAAVVHLLEEETYRDTAAAILGRLKDPAALEPLAGLLKSQTTTARRPSPNCSTRWKMICGWFVRRPHRRWASSETFGRWNRCFTRPSMIAIEACVRAASRHWASSVTPAPWTCWSKR